MSDYINIAVEGCCHGELDAIYSAILDAQSGHNVHIDLLLICGDFQSIRSFDDFDSVAVPNKYKRMNSFHDYFTGKKVAPVPTVFIGGNHENSLVLQSLHYGGFVAPNIYFLGYSGSVTFGGLRIAGVSGIYNEKHYRLGRYERPPYTEETVRSIYHMREVEVYRMAHLTLSARPVDVFLSHDWPENVWNYGDCAALLSKKPFLRDDLVTGRLGNPPLMQLLRQLRPSFWFSAHLHVKFAAVVPHADDDSSIDIGSFGNSTSVSTSIGTINCGMRPKATCTRFLALDKVMPGRDFLQVIAVPRPAGNESEGIHGSRLEYDVEWLAIVKKLHSLLQTGRHVVTVPATMSLPSPQEIMEVEESIRALNNNTLYIPNVSPMTAPLCQPIQPADPQTDFLLSVLGLPHVWTSPSATTCDIEKHQNAEISNMCLERNELDPKSAMIATIDKNEICLDDC